jgi:cytochrome P450
MLNWQRNGLAALETLSHEFGDVVHVHLPGLRAYLFGRPEFIKHVLVDNSDNYLKAPGGTHARMYFGDSMQLNNGEKARRLRHFLTPLFHHSHLANGFSMMVVRAVEDSIAQWSPGAKPDLTGDLMEMALSVAVQTHFGSAPGEDTQKLADLFRAALIRLNEVLLPAWMPTPAHNRYSRSIKALDSEVFRRIRARSATGPIGADLLSSLVGPSGSSDETLTDREIRHELVSMIAAAYQTIGIAINQTLRLVAHHPAVGERLFDEVTRVLSGSSALVQHLPHLVYTEQVVKEALRIAPPAGLLTRTTAANDTVGGWRIPAGSRVFVSAWVMHRDARYFTAPLSFSPERWTPEFERKLPLCAYFPFGRGARSCVAGVLSTMILKLMLVTVVQRFSMQADSGAATKPFKPFDPGAMPLTLLSRGEFNHAKASGQVI